MANRLYNQSICWLCANAVPSETTGCNWSREFKPVEGWEAELSTNKWANDFWISQGHDVYHVYKCPEFVKG